MASPALLHIKERFRNPVPNKMLGIYLDCISESPHYWPVHTQPTPRPLGGKITFTSAPTSGSIMTFLWAGTAGKRGENKGA